jgi:type II secretory pathway pseudopilin PulG
MIARLSRSESGFTYIAALVIVVIMGIMLGAVGQSVKVIMQREREKELIFRGLQYRDAIERWTKKGNMPLLELEHLLKDPRSATNDQHIRKLYKDPMTGGDWKVIKDPNTKEIQGVASTSGGESFKEGNFPEVIKNFQGKKKYNEWEFIYKRQVGATGTATAVPGSSAAAAAAANKPLSLPLSTPEGE